MLSSNGNISRVTSHLCGNSPVIDEFPKQKPVTRSFDVFFDLSLNKRLSKQSWGWWFETPPCLLWCHCNVSFNKFPMYCPHWYLPLNAGDRMCCNGEIRCELVNSLLGLTNGCVFNMAIKEISNGCRMVCKDLRSVLLNSPSGKNMSLYVICMEIHSSFGKDSNVRISNYHINGKWHKEHVPDSLLKNFKTDWNTWFCKLLRTCFIWYNDSI